MKIIVARAVVSKSFDTNDIPVVPLANRPDNKSILLELNKLFAAHKNNGKSNI